MGMELPDNDIGGGTGTTRKLKTFGFVGPLQGSPSTITLVTADSDGALTAHDPISPTSNNTNMVCTQGEDSIDVSGVSVYNGSVTVEDGAVNTTANALATSSADGWGDGETYNVQMTQAAGSTPTISATKVS